LARETVSDREGVARVDDGQEERSVHGAIAPVDIDDVLKAIDQQRRPAPVVQIVLGLLWAGAAPAGDRDDEVNQGGLGGLRALAGISVGAAPAS
jgi:hypothetical protein